MKNWREAQGTFSIFYLVPSVSFITAKQLFIKIYATHIEHMKAVFMITLDSVFKKTSDLFEACNFYINMGKSRKTHKTHNKHRVKSVWQVDKEKEGFKSLP